jgi:hypothetical protein
MKITDKILLALTGLFLLLLPLQFLFAGVGVFGGGYDTHEAFGAGLLHLVTLLVPIVALIARRWKVAGLWFGLFVAIFVQISLISIGRDAGSAWISALHPFMAFLYWPYVYFLVWLPLREETGAGDGGGEVAAA